MKPGGRRRRPWRTCARLGAGACALWLAACAGQPAAEPGNTAPPDPSAPAAAALVAAPLTWQLAWDTAGLQMAGAGADHAWELTNELGYRYRLRQGWVTTFRAELVPCPHDEAAGALPAAPWTWLAPRPRVALAGHGGAIDPSRTRHAVVEDLARPVTRTMDLTRTSDDPYCQAHLLVGPAAAEPGAAPADRAMAGQALRLAGEYQAPGADTWQPFAVEARQADGALVALCRADGHCGEPVLPDGSPLTLRLTRRLGSLFQGLAWDKVDDAERARAVLRNLTDGVTATVETASG